jgi:hypothetical protein
MSDKKPFSKSQVVAVVQVGDITAETAFFYSTVGVQFFQQNVTLPNIAF